MPVPLDSEHERDLRVYIAKLLSLYVNKLHVDPNGPDFAPTCKEFCRLSMTPFLEPLREPFPGDLVDAMIEEVVRNADPAR